MLRGETVELELVDGTKKTVDNVLVAQTDLTDMTVLDVQTRFINQARYKGDTSTLTLCWPKANHDELDSAHVTIRGHRYRVFSSPMWYDGTVCPTEWDREVTVIRSLFLYKMDLVRKTAKRDEWGVMQSESEYIPTMANLLRIATSSKRSAGQTDEQDLVMFEVPLDKYNGERYVRWPSGTGGKEYLITDTASATDNIVMTCKAGVADGKN